MFTNSSMRMLCSLYKISLSRHRILQFQNTPNTWKLRLYDKLKQNIVKGTKFVGMQALSKQANPYYFLHSVLGSYARFYMCVYLYRTKSKRAYVN
jgi:hypothetical protein